MTWKIGKFEKNQGRGDLSRPNITVTGFVSEDGVFGVTCYPDELTHIPSGMRIPEVNTLPKIDQYCDEMKRRGDWKTLGPLQLDPVRGVASGYDDPNFLEMKAAHREVVKAIFGIVQ